MFLTIIGTLTVRFLLIPYIVRFLRKKRFKKRGGHAPQGFSKQTLNVTTNKASLNLKLIREVEWKKFESLCCAYFIERDFDAKVTSIGADGGVDINIYKNGLDIPAMIVQCKAYKKNVGVKDIREFYGVLADSEAKTSVFITTSDFTPEAKHFAEGKTPQLQLVSGERLITLIENLTLEKQTKLLSIATEGDYKTPTCASCDVKMVVRNGKNGNFFGCCNFPRCRNTLHVPTR